MNARIYSLLLRLYPTELREDFGPEMMQVFLDDIDDNGAARAWWRSLKELCQIGLSTPRVMAPLFIYLSQTLYCCAAMRPHRGLSVLSVLLIPAFTTFLAFEVRDYEVPDHTPLSRRV